MQQLILENCSGGNPQLTLIPVTYQCKFLNWIYTISLTLHALIIRQCSYRVNICTDSGYVYEIRSTSKLAKKIEFLSSNHIVKLEASTTYFVCADSIV